MQAIRADEELSIGNGTIVEAHADRLLVSIQRRDGSPEPDVAVAFDALIENVHELATHDIEVAISEQAAAQDRIRDRHSLTPVSVENDQAVDGIVNRFEAGQAKALARVIAGVEQGRHVVLVAQIVPWLDDQYVITLTG